MTDQERRNARIGERVVKMGRELCSALETEKESHGNIWPGNVNLDEDGKATLGEGSKVPVSSRSADQVEFLAPETFWENESTPASDAYSIALIMYAAYNGGRLPFADADGDESASRAKALRARMKGQEIPPLENASPAINAILAKALAYESADRYENPAELLRALSETDEALPSTPPAEEEELREPEKPQAEETAEKVPAEEVAAVEVASEETTSAEEPEVTPEETPEPENENGKRLSMAELRPEEAAAGITADSIVMESELENMGREKPAKKNKSKKAKEPKSTASESETPKNESVPKQEKKDDTQAENKKNPAKPKQYTVDKSMEKPKKSAADKKKKNKSTRNTLLVAGLAAVVVAAIIGVGVHALNTATEEVLLSPTQAPVEVATPEPTAEPTPEPTPEPTADTQRITGYTTDKSWSELVNPDEDGEQAVDLLVITDAETFDAAVAAAKEAGLSNVWLGARYVEKTEESGVEESGWYWLDGTQLPTNSSYWADGEPSEEADAGLMMSETEDGWRFFSVSETTFAEAAEDAYPNLGYLVSDSGIRPAVTPSTAPDAETTDDDTEATTDKEKESASAGNNTDNNTNSGSTTTGGNTATGGNTGSGSSGSGSNSGSSVVVSAPVITKDPTGESVTEGGSCKFLAYAAAANNCTWYLVSPDGSETVSAGNAANRFSGLKVSGAWSNLLELKNIPLSMNNWKVYCSFSGAGGTTATGSARLEVSANPVTSPTPTTTPTPTPTATPTPTPTPKVTAVKATGSWEQISTTKTLAIAAKEEVREAVEDAAEKLSLENVWIGARYMTVLDDEVESDGWYWIDKTPVDDADEPEKWVDGTVPVTGDWLMLSLVDHDGNPETDKVWRYRAVVKTGFEATDYANLGYVCTDIVEESSSTPKSEAISLQESFVSPVTDGMVLIPVGESKLFSGVRG